MEFQAFKNKIWLSSPTMHGEEMQYVTEAYETNWMSTVGANINEIERSICEKLGCGYAVALSAGTASLHMAVKLAGEKLYGQTELGKGALSGRQVPVAAEVIPVEGDIGAVRILKALFRLKGKPQSVAVDHFRGKVIQVIVKIGGQAWCAVLGDQLHFYVMVCIEQIILFVLPRFCAAKVGVAV